MSEATVAMDVEVDIPEVERKTVRMDEDSLMSGPQRPGAQPRRPAAGGPVRQPSAPYVPVIESPTMGQKIARVLVCISAVLLLLANFFLDIVYYPFVARYVIDYLVDDLFWSTDHLLVGIVQCIFYALPSILCASLVSLIYLMCLYMTVPRKWRLLGILCVLPLLFHMAVTYGMDFLQWFDFDFSFRFDGGIGQWSYSIFMFLVYLIPYGGLCILGKGWPVRIFALICLFICFFGSFCEPLVRNVCYDLGLYYQAYWITCVPIFVVKIVRSLVLLFVHAPKPKYVFVQH